MIVCSAVEAFMVDDMGTFRTTILVESAAHRSETRTVENALVDTGSEYTWVPRDVLDDLGIRPERTQRFIVADGRQLERPIGIAIVHAAGRWRQTSSFSRNPAT